MIGYARIEATDQAKATLFYDAILQPLDLIRVVKNPYNVDYVPQAALDLIPVQRRELGPKTVLHCAASSDRRRRLLPRNQTPASWFPVACSWPPCRAGAAR